LFKRKEERKRGKERRKEKAPKGKRNL